MVSLNNPAQRINLLRAVSDAFETAGWKIEKRNGFTHDFLMGAGNLYLPVRCVDDSRIDFESPSTTVTRLEGNAREMRNLRNRQLVIIFDRNFLGVPLEGLVDREIFAITLDEVASVTALITWSEGVPDGADPRQLYLLERSLDYAISVSKRLRDKGDLPAAIAWGQCALRHSVGFTQAYLYLFGLLKHAGEFDAAAALSEKIQEYRSDDPQLIRGMIDLSRRRGDKAGVARWTARLTEQPTTPRSLDAILAKQKRQSGQPTPPPADVPDVPAAKVEKAPATSGLARLLSGLGRRARGRTEPR